MSAVSQRVLDLGHLQMKRFVSASFDDQEDSELYITEETMKSNRPSSKCSKFYEKTLSLCSKTRPRSKSKNRPICQNVINISDDSSDEDLCILYEVNAKDEEVVILSDRPKSNLNENKLTPKRTTSKSYYDAKFEKSPLDRFISFESNLFESGLKINKKPSKGVITIDDEEAKTSVDYSLNKEMPSLFKLTGPSFIETLYKKKYFCHICSIDVLNSKEVHDKSIAHIMNLGPANTDPIYSIPNTNIGFKMLIKQGWSVDRGLGREGNGPLHPVKVTPKNDRLGLGIKIKKKPKNGLKHRPKLNCELGQKGNYRPSCKFVKSKS